jgi:tetratricopeptide (TPR) repeat protein
MGQYEEAETSLEKAMAIQQRFLDEDNILLALTFDNLAKTVNAVGQNEKAEFFSKKALRAVHENADYANHPFLAEALNTRAKILLDLGQYEESRTCLARALCIQEQVYDEEHPLMAVTLNNIERALRKLGHKEEAKSCLHRARAIEKAHTRANAHTRAHAHTRRCLVS